MFRNALQHLHKPLDSSVFTNYATQWTLLAVLSFAGLIIGLDNTILSGALLSLPGQMGAEGSALQWIARAKAIAVWSGTEAAEIGLGQVAGLLLVVSTRSLARGSSSSTK
jgi:hypothetical protein